ncbi:MAG: hypothetical protein A2X40_10910 [Elusimicrobia bacterium GWC2_65_9]|nr:MAG: hypothetical protein A2X40_10910 [Elusimicrobia bacterium GWC2_65_9]
MTGGVEGMARLRHPVELDDRITQGKHLAEPLLARESHRAHPRVGKLHLVESEIVLESAEKTASLEQTLVGRGPLDPHDIDGAGDELEESPAPHESLQEFQVRLELGAGHERVEWNEAQAGLDILFEEDINGALIDLERVSLAVAPELARRAGFRADEKMLKPRP